MQVRLFVCAESTSLDAGTNRISLFHLLDEIGAPAFPATMPHMTVLAILERTADEPPAAQFQLQVGLENSVSLLVNMPLNLEFQDRLATRMLTVLRGVVIPEPVGIRVALNHNGTEIARWTIPVVQTGPAMASPQLAPDPGASVPVAARADEKPPVTNVPAKPRA